MTLNNQYAKKIFLTNPSRSDGKSTEITIISDEEQDLEWVTSKLDYLIPSDNNLVPLSKETIEKVLNGNTYILPKFFLNFLAFPQSCKNVNDCEHGFQNNINIYSFQDSYCPGGKVLRDVFLYFVTQATKHQERTIYYKTTRALLNVVGKRMSGRSHKKLQKDILHLQKISVKVIRDGKIFYDGPIFDQPDEQKSKQISFNDMFFKKFIMTNEFICMTKKDLFSGPKNMYMHILTTVLKYEQNILSSDKRKYIHLEELIDFCSVLPSPSQHRQMRKRIKDYFLSSSSPEGVEIEMPDFWLSHIEHNLLENNNKENHNSFFKIKSNNVNHYKRWGQSEEFLREELQMLTGRKFKKVRPSWLTNPDTGVPLELDMYDEDSKVAFEYNGAQHYRPVPCFGGLEGFKMQQRRDLVKQALCQANGVKLIIVDGTKFSVEDKPSFRKHIKKIGLQIYPNIV